MTGNCNLCKHFAICGQRKAGCLAVNALPLDLAAPTSSNPLQVADECKEELIQAIYTTLPKHCSHYGVVQ